MLLDNKCSTVVSIKVVLTMDDGTIKERTIGFGDLIDVQFNCNGVRRCTEGRVVKVYAEGSDPKKWYIIVDSADDFESKQYKFSPTNIIDLEIIQKKDQVKFIYSPDDYTNITALRVVKGRLQYTQDGINWYFMRIDNESVIKDEEGTTHYHNHHHHDVPPCPCQEDDIIHDEVNP